MNDSERKAIATAIFDPGVFVGFKGDRTLTEWQVDAVEASLTALRAHNSDSAGPVAWVFELARAHHLETGEYTDWGPEQLSFTEPCVPDGSVRNLRPLYLASHTAKEVEITDEMVDRALASIDGEPDLYISKGAMRWALEAALK